MSSILFLTYYYSPCNATATNRPNSFVQNLINHGHSVTVVTRHWTGNEKVWPDYLKSDMSPVKIVADKLLTVHYLPYSGFRYWRVPFATLGTILQNLKGNFNYEQQCGQFNSYAEELLKNNSFDYIMVSSPPLTAVKYGSALATKYQLPLLVDIRDFENDILLYKERKHGWFRQQQHLLLMRFFKKWMKTAKVVVTASPPLTSYIQKIASAEVITLNNGFNNELLAINEPPDKDWFAITVTGTLYEMANLPVMVEACKLVMQRHPEAKIKFHFIGLLMNEKVSAMFREAVPEKNIEITHRIPQSAAIKKASSSNVLMLAGFDEMTGAYTTKIFEYLGLRRNILQIPGDRDVVEELILQTKSGKAPHTAEEAYRDIIDWYEEWKKKGVLAYSGDMEKIAEYSREKQFEKLLTKIK